MKFRFPIVIIDEDFRSENASGLGIRALADAIEKEGMEILGVTSYGDLTSFAQQQSRASAFLLSIDDEEFGEGSEEETKVALKSLRAFVEEIRFKNADIPIYLYGETRTSRHIPNDVLRELHGFIHMHTRTRRNSWHATSSAKRVPTSTRWRRRSSARCCITLRMAPTHGIVRGTRVVWHF
jgi:arginine decarboxylase